MHFMRNGSQYFRDVSYVEPITAAELHLFEHLNEIPDLHDRIIAATALRLGISILTRDEAITACAEVTCVW